MDYELTSADDHKIFNIYSNTRNDYVPDEEIISEFEWDWCLSLAFCIHKKYGYPLAYVRVSPTLDGSNWGMLFTDIFHVVVKVSDNYYLDITGLQTEEQLIKKYQKEFNTVVNITHDYMNLPYQYGGEFNIDEVVDKLIELYLFCKFIYN